MPSILKLKKTSWEIAVMLSKTHNVTVPGHCFIKLQHKLKVIVSLEQISMLNQKCSATIGALQSLRRRRCQSNLKTDDKVCDPLLACSLLEQAKCNKILLSPALVEYQSLFTGSFPLWVSCAEACCTLVYPGFRVSRASCVCLGSHRFYLLSELPKWCRSNSTELHTDYTTSPCSNGVNGISV